MRLRLPIPRQANGAKSLSGGVLWAYLRGGTMTKQNEAVSLMRSGANCAQSVFCSFACDFGVARETAMSVAAPFGGGMGAMGGTCGAVTGAFMALGMKHGVRDLEQMGRKKSEVYGDVQQFARRFTEKNGSLLCKELLGCDISTPDGIKTAREKGLFSTRCVQLVADAVEIAEGMV
jgi:C_GCAxxG_C_C family probable redox protein